jgi:hypothetical protein
MIPKTGGDRMNIVHKKSEVYGLQKQGKIHRIIKIIKEYDNEQDAVRDMTRLLTGKITEQELIEGKEE